MPWCSNFTSTSEDAEREAARWESGSVADALAGLAAEDPDWATVVVEQSRRRRTDPTFRNRWTRRTNLVRNALHTLVGRERAAGRITPTIPDEVAARFISVVGDGLLLQQAILGEVPHAQEVVALATAALAGSDREPPAQGPRPGASIGPTVQRPGTARPELTTPTPTRRRQAPRRRSVADPGSRCPPLSTPPDADPGTVDGPRLSHPSVSLSPVIGVRWCFTQEASVHPLLLEELAAARIDDLRRQASRERRDLPLLRPSPAARAARRSLQAFGFLLVGAGLRLATAGERQGPAGRIVR